MSNHPPIKDMMVSEFLYEFIGKYRVSKKNIEKLSKMEIMFTFPNLYPGTKTVIVLKQPKTERSVRVVNSPKNVLDSLSVLREMQNRLKEELEPDGCMDYNVVICQANGYPIMTEHLNKRLTF